MNGQTSDVAFSIPISAGHLWIIWILVVGVFCIMSWVLVHHWRYYGIKGNNRIFAKSLFFVGGIAALVIMALLIAAYSIVQ